MCIFLCKVNLTLFDELIIVLNNYYECFCAKQTVTNWAISLDPLDELKYLMKITSE